MAPGTGSGGFGIREKGGGKEQNMDKKFKRIKSLDELTGSTRTVAIREGAHLIKEGERTYISDLTAKLKRL